MASAFLRRLESNSAYIALVLLSGRTKIRSAKSSHFKETDLMKASSPLLRPSYKTLGLVHSFVSELLEGARLEEITLFVAARNLRTSVAATAKLSASPSPLNAFTPINFPSSDKSGPPEFPGLIGVCV